MAVIWKLHVSAISLLLLVATASASSDTSACRLLDCPNYRTIRYYEELGCVRSDGSNDCCPTHFNCSSILSVGESNCYYNGRTYENDERVRTNDPCSEFCYCDTDWGEARLSCAMPACEGFLPPEGKESVCYPSFSLDWCCGAGLKCANDTKSPRNVAECVYEGHTYLEGQFITNSECKKCICQEGYDGTLNGPWCRRVSCNYFFWYPVQELQRSAPLFPPDGKCCAFGLHYPSYGDTVVRHSDPSTANGGVQCSYGNHLLSIGDEVLAGQVRCVCEVPPFVTCIE